MLHLCIIWDKINESQEQTTYLAQKGHFKYRISFGQKEKTLEIFTTTKSRKFPISSLKHAQLIAQDFDEKISLKKNVNDSDFLDHYNTPSFSPWIPDKETDKFLVLLNPPKRRPVFDARTKYITEYSSYNEARDAAIKMAKRFIEENTLPQHIMEILTENLNWVPKYTIFYQGRYAAEVDIICNSDSTLNWILNEVI